MSNKPNYACPQCGAVEFITPLNSADRYMAIGGKLCWQASEPANLEFELYCRECGERTPPAFECVAQ